MIEKQLLITLYNYTGQHIRLHNFVDNICGELLIQSLSRKSQYFLSIKNGIMISYPKNGIYFSGVLKLDENSCVYDIIVSNNGELIVNSRFL